jgi:hypothetical protein
MSRRTRPGDDMEVTPATVYRRVLRERMQAEKAAETVAQRRAGEKSASALVELHAGQRQTMRAAQRREDLRLKMATAMQDAVAVKVAAERDTSDEAPVPRAGPQRSEPEPESYATTVQRQTKLQRKELRAGALIDERRRASEKSASALAELHAGQRQTMRAAQRREDLRLKMAAMWDTPAAQAATERETSDEAAAPRVRPQRSEVEQKSYAAEVQGQTRVQREIQRTGALINERRRALSQERSAQTKHKGSPDSAAPKQEQEPPTAKRAARPREEDRAGAPDTRRPPRADDRLNEQARARPPLEAEPRRSRREAAASIKTLRATHRSLDTSVEPGRVARTLRRAPDEAGEPPAKRRERPSRIQVQDPGSIRFLGGVARRPVAGTFSAHATRRMAGGAELAPVVPTSCVQAQAGFLVDDNSDAVNLRGVSVRGLDTVAPQAGQAFPDALSLDADNLAAMTQQWGVNLVRLPFAADTILSGNGTIAAADLLAGLDLAIASITEAGAYVLLALEAAPGAVPDDASTLNVWATLAARYSTEPRVFYELFYSVAPLLPAAAVQLATAVNQVRQQDPASLLFVNAGLGGLDTSLVPVLSAPGSPAPNIVYTVTVPADLGALQEQLSTVSDSYPLFASMWADDGTDYGRLSTYIAALFGRCGIGWAAANWNSAPALVADAVGHDFTPTAWGAVARWAYSLPVRPLLEPASAATSLSTMRAADLPMPSLSVAKNSIVDDAGNRVSLRGVTVAGVDSAGVAPGQTLADALSLDSINLALMRGLWELNLVRVPFQAQTILFGTAGLSAARVVSGLDLLIARLSNAGAYTLLTVQAPDGAGAPPAPDAFTARAWQVLASRYKNEPGVIYELFSASDPLASTWPSTAQEMVGIIRKQNSAALLLLGSGLGGVDVTGLPYLLPDGSPMPNVAYTVSVSPQSPPGADDDPVAALADRSPVFALWSDDADSPSRLSPRAADFFSRHNIHWAAANWNADPRLVVDAINHDLSETSWGLIAKRAAMLPPRAPLNPLDAGA